MGDQVEMKARGKRTLSQFRYDSQRRIFLEGDEPTIEYSDGLEVEARLLETVRRARDVGDDSAELMQHAQDWPSFYHLGVGRSNILKSLQLAKDSRVLEMGSGCGAITRYLGERCAAVDGIEGNPVRAQIARERCRDLENVRLFCGNIGHIDFEPVYDVVILVGVVEYAPMFLDVPGEPSDMCLSLMRRARRALRKNGVMVLAIENKIGLKYWSGCPEDHTGRLYDSIHGYPLDGGPVTFSKTELVDMLETAGFPDHYCYYCFPDYKFADTIISDLGDESELFLHNWIQVPFNSYVNLRQHTFHEGLAARTLARSGLLRQFANSFLIVAHDGETEVVSRPDWVARHYSLARIKELQCVTTLKTKPDIHVEKKTLADHGGSWSVSDSSMTVTHEVGTVPWRRGDLLTFGFFSAAFGSDPRGRILGLLEVYYRELKKRYYSGEEDEDGYPLLSGKAIDFIPRNIVWDNGGLYFIDAEWSVSSEIPADFVLYRCISEDVVETLRYWPRGVFKNIEGLKLNLMRAFFPGYTIERHQQNQERERRFQALVVGGRDRVVKAGGWERSEASTGRRLVSQVWNTLPEGVRMRISSWLAWPGG